MRIAQIVLQQLTPVVERPYEVERGSRYQGQRGAQARRLELEE